MIYHLTSDEQIIQIPCFSFFFWMWPCGQNQDHHEWKKNSKKNLLNISIFFPCSSTYFILSLPNNQIYMAYEDINKKQNRTVQRWQSKYDIWKKNNQNSKIMLSVWRFFFRWKKLLFLFFFLIIILWLWIMVISLVYVTVTVYVLPDQNHSRKSNQIAISY